MELPAAEQQKDGPAVCRKENNAALAEEKAREEKQSKAK